MKLGFDVFSKIANYGNENWKGCFSADELAEYTEVYFEEYKYSVKHNELSPILISLMNLLIEDMGELSIDAPTILDFELVVDNFVRANFK